ncbi:YegP family protein, partial [Staphylococcus argenteus]|nr:YegP family protein [Staphylococcus argenteus]
PYFVLKAKNHQVIGVSEMYSSESAAKNGIQSVMKNGPTTDIRDLSA